MNGSFQRKRDGEGEEVMLKCSEFKRSLMLEKFLSQTCFPMAGKMAPADRWIFMENKSEFLDLGKQLPLAITITWGPH